MKKYELTDIAEMFNDQQESIKDEFGDMTEMDKYIASMDDEDPRKDALYQLFYVLPKMWEEK